MKSILQNKIEKHEICLLSCYFPQTLFQRMQNDKNHDEKSKEREPYR